jgi:hypothetical protein
LARTGHYGDMMRVSRWTLTFSLAGLFAAGLLAGCGDNNTPGTPTPGQTTAAPAPVGQTVTVQRTGGIAGVSEMIVIGADGAWTFTDQKSGKTEKGQLTPAQLMQLAQLALDPRVGAEAQASAAAVCNDAFQYAITAGDQSYRFEDCGQDKPALKALLTLITGSTPL